MAKITIDVPDEVAEELKELKELIEKIDTLEIKELLQQVNETTIDGVTAKVAIAVKRRWLRRYDIDAKAVLVDGERYAQVGRYEATYFAKEGPIEVMRSLYRRCGERNAKTVDTISLQLGVVDQWLPCAAKAAGFLLQQGTGREAEATAHALGVFPYSRSSFDRVAHKVGELHEVVRDDVEDELIERLTMPRAARAISVSIDRVAVPMEEPRKRSAGRPKKGEAKRPIERVWHMAYVGTVTIHDRKGEALHTIRYGRMPGHEPDRLAEGMRSDVERLLAKRRSLRIALVTDGAREMVDVLDRHFDPQELGVDVHRVVDFWHVIEKLGAAAKVMFGEDGAKPVIARWKMLLLNSATAAQRVTRELERSGMRDVAIGDQRPVHDAITFMINQGPRMNYPAARAVGLPIGSGNVEATCKSLFRQRLVRSGSRWKETTGQHIVDLRALALSNRFDAAIDMTLARGVRDVRAA